MLGVRIILLLLTIVVTATVAIDDGYFIGITTSSEQRRDRNRMWSWTPSDAYHPIRNATLPTYGEMYAHITSASVHLESNRYFFSEDMWNGWPCRDSGSEPDSELDFPPHIQAINITGPDAWTISLLRIQIRLPTPKTDKDRCWRYPQFMHYSTDDPSHPDRIWLVFETVASDQVDGAMMLCAIDDTRTNRTITLTHDSNECQPYSDVFANGGWYYGWNHNAVYDPNQKIIHIFVRPIDTREEYAVFRLHTDTGVMDTTPTRCQKGLDPALLSLRYHKHQAQRTDNKTLSSAPASAADEYSLVGLVYDRWSQSSYRFALQSPGNSISDSTADNDADDRTSAALCQWTVPCSPDPTNCTLPHDPYPASAAVAYIKSKGLDVYFVWMLYGSWYQIGYGANTGMEVMKSVGFTSYEPKFIHFIPSSARP